jgi:hypothetical protein
VLFFIPWFDSFTKSLNGSYLPIYIELSLLLLDDRRSGGIRLPYVLAFVLFALMQFSMNFARGWAFWHMALNSFAGYR